MTGGSKCLGIRCVKSLVLNKRFCRIRDRYDSWPLEALTLVSMLFTSWNMTLSTHNTPVLSFPWSYWQADKNAGEDPGFPVGGWGCQTSSGGGGGGGGCGRPLTPICSWRWIHQLEIDVVNSENYSFFDLHTCGNVCARNWDESIAIPSVILLMLIKCMTL